MGLQTMIVDSVADRVWVGREAKQEDFCWSGFARLGWRIAGAGSNLDIVALRPWTVRGRSVFNWQSSSWIFTASEFAFSDLILFLPRRFHRRATDPCVRGTARTSTTARCMKSSILATHEVITNRSLGYRRFCVVSGLQPGRMVISDAAARTRQNGHAVGPTTRSGHHHVTLRAGCAGGSRVMDLRRSLPLRGRA